MRIALVTAQHPSGRGGAEVLYEGLEAALREAGHQVDRREVPFDESTFERILEGYRRARDLDLGAYDAVISTKAPTYAVQHSRHIVYLLHTIRVFYDMFDSWTDGSARACQQRDAIRELDFEALAGVPEERRFAIGHEVAGRLWDALGLQASVLYPALPDADRFRPGPFEHILHAGRLHLWKRVSLLLEAFRLVSADIPLLLTGTGEEMEALREQARGDQRVRFLGDVPRERLYDLFARSLVVPFAPVREDYGYVAIEAMLSEKPVVTAADSGEVARIVEHEQSGLIVAPAPETLAAAIQRFIRHPEDARRMGAAGRQRALGIRWPENIAALLGSVSQKKGRDTVSVPGRSALRLLVLDNQPIEPPIGGGRLRLQGLYSHLPADIEPRYVGTYDWPGPGYRAVRHGGRLVEITVPQSEAHFRAHEALRGEDPRLTMDVTFSMFAPLSGAFLNRARYEAENADAVVFSHPWVYAALAPSRALRGKPLFYDAQNFETRHWRELLGTEGFGGSVAAQLASLERSLCDRAAAVFACSEQDAGLFESVHHVPRERLFVVPNGVDTRRLAPASTAERREARAGLRCPDDGVVAVFVGSNFPPNVDAARFLCGRVAPRLPSVRFLLVGGCSAALAPADIPPNVVPLGVVSEEERNAAFAGADLAVNPVSRGSGTNIKMLDYFAAGLATVSTPVGARGLAVEDGDSLLLAPLDAFADTIARLAGDETLRGELGHRARRLAETQYDWRIISHKLAAVLRQRVGRDRRTGRRARRPPSRPLLALLSTWRSRCGIAAYTEMLCRAFPKGPELRVYAEETGGTAIEEVSVVHNWRYGGDDLRRLEGTLREERPDILLVQYHRAFLPPSRLASVLRSARRSGARTAVNFHSLELGEFGPDSLEELRRVDRILLHREEDRERLAAAGIEGPMDVIPQGMPRFVPRSRREVRTALGLAEGFSIGHFGYLRPHKGVLELVEAFDGIAAARPEARLLLLCAEYPSPDSRAYRPAVEARIAASPHRERISFTASHLPEEQAAYLLQACDLIVFPYHPSAESASGAVRFGIAARRAILVSPSQIFDELAGVACVSPGYSPDCLAANILDLAARPDSLEECAERVRRFAASRDWARIAALTWGSLRPLVSSREGRRNPAA